MSSFMIAELAAAIPAGILIVASLMFKDQLKFRVVNLAGSILFVVYGVLLVVLSGMTTGWSTMLLNVFGSVIHIVHLARGKKRKA